MNAFKQHLKFGMVLMICALLVAPLFKGSAIGQTKDDKKNSEAASKVPPEGVKQSQEPEPPKEKPKLPPPPPAVNPETLRMMELIERKNRELKKREDELALRERNLKILENNVRQDLRKIEAALVKSQEQVGIKKNLIERNVNSLVKVYSAMKPDQAATLLETLDEGVAIQLISKMKSKTAGAVLGRMNTKTAKRISEKIAGKRFDDMEAQAK